MQWSATDQFGNLYTGDSAAVTVQELMPDLSSLLEELKARAGDRFVVTMSPTSSELRASRVSTPTSRQKM
jgi:hypothetical protein